MFEILPELRRDAKTERFLVYAWLPPLVIGDNEPSRLLVLHLVVAPFSSEWTEPFSPLPQKAKLPSLVSYRDSSQLALRVATVVPVRSLWRAAALCSDASRKAARRFLSASPFNQILVNQIWLFEKTLSASILSGVAATLLSNPTMKPSSSRNTFRPMFALPLTSALIRRPSDAS